MASTHRRPAWPRASSQVQKQDQEQERQQQQQQQQAATSATEYPRQQLARAQQLLLSHDRNGAWRAYTLALHESESQGSFDLSACFLCHFRLAQLSLPSNTAFDNNGGGTYNGGGRNDSNSRAIARRHLEAAWALRDHLAPPLKGALGCYFRAVRLKLSGLCDDDVDTRQSLSNGGGEKAGGGRRETQKGVRSPCDGCGKLTKGGRRGRGAGATAATAAVAEEGGQYCLDCTDAYDKAVSQGPISDGTPCAGCEDRTQPVSIEPDGKWYCEACIEEFYEEAAAAAAAAEEAEKKQKE
ncbi:unnamed protein product [Pylaiella littoralis]